MKLDQPPTIKMWLSRPYAAPTAKVITSRSTPPPEANQNSSIDSTDIISILKSNDRDKVVEMFKQQ